MTNVKICVFFVNCEEVGGVTGRIPLSERPERGLLADRIRRARVMRGLSLREVAARAGLSPQAISKYERGLDVPTSKSLIKLGKALGVGVEYLLRPGPELRLRPAYRQRARMRKRKKQVEAVVEQARELLERWITAEELVLGKAQQFRRPDGLPRHVANPEDAEAAARNLRAKWGVGAGPVADLSGLLALHKIRTAEVEAPEDFDGLLLVDEDNGYAFIAVRSGMPGDRQRFTLAHELAHLVLELPDHPDAERLCHRFAGAFLVPPDDLRAWLGDRRRRLEVQELLWLKWRYGASMQVLVRRARDLGIIAESKSKSLFRLFRKKGWHRREPGEQVPPERLGVPLEELVERGVAEGIISRERARELLGGRGGEVLA